MSITSQFQSTLPVWGGTAAPLKRLQQFRISIHPPRVGRDFLLLVLASMLVIFQSTLPVWGGTMSPFIAKPPISISIHPPRVGRDTRRARPCNSNSNFNPPSPCGEGHGNCISPVTIKQFQSTLPVWGGTSYRTNILSKEIFQSTLPVWGGTVNS